MAAEIERDAIAARAYALYVRGGRRPGRALDDWVEAERQLKAEQTGPSPSALAMTVPAAKTLVPGAAVPSGRPALVTPPPSAPAVPAAHAEAAKATSPKVAPAAAAKPVASAAPAQPPAPAQGTQGKAAGQGKGGGGKGQNKHKKKR